MESKIKSFDSQAYSLNKLALENESLKIQEQVRQKEMSENNPDEIFVLLQVKNTIDEVLSGFEMETEPEKILVKALSGLNKVEQKRFVIENLIEGVKHGENLGDLNKRYESLGFMTSDQDKGKKGKISPSRTYPKTPHPGTPPTNTGKYLWGLFTGVLRSVARRLMAIITIAIRAIPHFVNVVPIIGFTGVFPSLSFSIEAGDMSLQDLWELLIDADKSSGS